MLRLNQRSTYLSALPRARAARGRERALQGGNREGELHQEHGIRRMLTSLAEDNYGLSETRLQN